MNSTRPTVVLVHGALTDASVWRSVSAALQEQGVSVLAPALPMRSFEGDVAYVRSVLEGREGPLVVVAHSYAGSVVSAPAALTPAVRALVFVAAFQQDAGETPGGLNGQFPGSRLVPENLLLREYPGGTEVSLRPERFAEVYAADVDAREVAIMSAAQHPFDARTLEGGFSGTPTWRSLPSWALVSTSDVSIPTQALRHMASRAGSTVVEVDSSHAVPVAHPDAVVGIIGSAVQAVATDH
jgi:pimeloyl-ACP methyl ester carboxylesterase